MPKTKKSLLKTICTTNVVGCGACTDQNPSDVIQPKPKTNNSGSETAERGVSCAKIIDSVAVVKESSDPYEDFRESMMQMIKEKEMHSKEDLKELLNCFLELNSHVHHHLILQAFSEILSKHQLDSPNPK